MLFRKKTHAHTLFGIFDGNDSKQQSLGKGEGSVVLAIDFP